MRSRKVRIIVLTGVILLHSLYGFTAAEEIENSVIYEDGEMSDFWDETEEMTDDISETEEDGELWEEMTDDEEESNPEGEPDPITEEEESETEIMMREEEIEKIEEGIEKIEEETGEETDIEAETEPETEGEQEEKNNGIEDVKISGIPVFSAKGWQKAEKFSAESIPLRFYPNISYLEVFNESDQVESTQGESEMIYLYPNAEGQEGLFGGIYHNVLYKEGKWYDLRMSVASYVSKNGENTEKSEQGLGCVGFSDSELGISWMGGKGDLVLRCEICDAKTQEITPLDIRFQWMGIGYGQKCGIRALDGVISGKYYIEDSDLYIQQNQNVSGIEQIEIVQGASEEGSSACYELTGSSSYYLTLGLCEYEKQERILHQTGEIPGRILDDSPDIRESRNRTDYFTDMELSEEGKDYWYRISQYVPLQSQEYYYSDYQIKDVLPEGVSCLGNISMIREEDGRDVSERFIITSADQVVLATARKETVSEANFYGYHYRMEFQCTFCKEAMIPEVEEQKIKYVVENQPVMNCRQSGETVFASYSGTVARTCLVQQYQKPECPEFSMDPETYAAERILCSREDEIVMTVHQKIPEHNDVFAPDYLELKYHPEECLEIEKIELLGKKKQSELFEEISEEVLSQQEIQVKWKYEKDYAGGELCLMIRCRLSRGKDLTPFRQKTEEGYRMEIQNKATVTFQWENEKIEPLCQETKKATLFYIEKQLQLSVQIKGSDIVWDHGNPTFLLRIEGEDLTGRRQEFHRVVEFTPETEVEEYMQKQVELIVPAGEYEVYSQEVIRYRMEKITDIVNGEQKEDHVVFHLADKGMGGAVLVYEKSTDEGGSDTCFVENIIG